MPPLRMPELQHWLALVAADPSAMHEPHDPELRHTFGLAQLEFVVHLQIPPVSVPPLQQRDALAAADPIGVHAPQPPLARHTDGLAQLLLVVHDVVQAPARQSFPDPQSAFTEHAPQCPLARQAVPDVQLVEVQRATHLELVQTSPAGEHWESVVHDPVWQPMASVSPLLHETEATEGIGVTPLIGGGRVDVVFSIPHADGANPTRGGVVVLS